MAQNSLKPWQKSWAIFIILGSIWHSIRDTLQFLHVPSILSSTFVEHKTTHYWLWNPWNTVFIEVIFFILAIIILKRQRFGSIGASTIFFVICTLSGYAYYWFLVK